MHLPQYYRRAAVATFLLLAQSFSAVAQNREANPSTKSFQRWLQPQKWERDTEGPILGLGKAGDFDDRHIFAPLVAFERNRFRILFEYDF